MWHCSLNSLVLLALVALVSSETINKDITFKKYERKIDLSSQLVKFSHKIVVETTGTSIKNFLFTLTKEEHDKISYISAKTGSHQLTHKKATVEGHPGYHFYKIDLRETLVKGKTATVEVEVVLTGAVTPYPAQISQGEKQLVVFEGSHLVTAAYQVTSQSTVVSTPSSNIESYTRYKPTSHSDSTINYGPYDPTPAFSADPLRIHYENNGPFLTITRLERAIELSHWGNIAVEETLDIVHSGAKLKGSFSRFDYQRDHNDYAVIKSLHTILPASASDVYYRDEIGNITTSQMKIRENSVELDLRPRFPLFGGWKTHYKIGYNVPSYEYLFYKGDQYALRMRFLDHIYEEMAVDEMVLRIVLPEGVTDVKMSTPYSVEEPAFSLHPTYLDTIGRVVVTVRATKLCPRHIQDFVLVYKFSAVRMLQEPMLVVAVFLALFLAAMVWVRVDLSLTQDKAAEARVVVVSLCQKLVEVQGGRGRLYQGLVGEMAKQQGSGNPPKAAAVFQASCSKLQQQVKDETKAIADLVAKIRSADQGCGVNERLGDLLKADKEVQDALNAQVLNMGKLLRGGLTKQAFADSDATLVKQRTDAMAKCRAVIAKL